MAFYESESVELKLLLSDDINKEVVAFANTSGGVIHVGIDDNGTVVGIQDINESYTRLTNIIRDTIVPDVTIFTKYELLSDNTIKISVSEGCSKPYFLKKNGIKPSGVYVRQGTSAAQATWEQIRQFIKYADGDSFESTSSILQDLTFESAADEFRRRNIKFEEDNYIALGIKDIEKGLYTNLALLISDQCTHSIKVAVFEDPDRTIFVDRRDFSGSIFKQLHDTYEYLMLNNRTSSVINGLDRIDSIEYPPEAIREALLNSIVHRDYAFSGSIIININRECMEFISIGGLLPGLSANDIMSGISQSRNPKLANVFFRLKHIEAYGTGIRRIFNLYGTKVSKPIISVTENTFRLTLPNLNVYKEISDNEKRVIKNTSAQNHLKIDAQMKVILNYLSQIDSVTDEKIMELLSIKKTRAYIVARQMVEMGIIKVLGRGKRKKYVRS